LNSKKAGYSFLIISSVLLFFFLFIHSNHGNFIHLGEENTGNSTDDNREERLNVLLFTHYSDYFIHRGVPMGFQYELFKNLSAALGRKLSITFENDPNAAYSAAFSNHYDIVAMDFKKSLLIKQLITPSLPFSTSYPVLIQRKEVPAIPPQKKRKIYLPAHFPGTIEKDSLEKPSEWEIIYSSTLTIEELIDLLDKKKINYTVSDYHTAITLLPFYSDLEIVSAVGKTYKRTWVLNDSNKTLNKQINSWLHIFTHSKKYKFLERKYFSPYTANRNMPLLESRYHKISPFDNIVKKYAKKANIDWRLIISIMYQESKFVTGLYGMGESFGLMQLMPSTGEKYNISSESSDEEQIKAAILHLIGIQNLFPEVEEPEDKLKFMCAAYNSGAGHIKDAQRLCEKYGEDPTRWASVSKYLILKAKKQYYNDPVVQNGYYPGSHTVKYVEQIWERFSSYKAIIKK